MSKFQRTTNTKLVYTSVGTFGWFLYAFGPAVNLLGEEQHITKLVMSLHMSAYALGTMAGVFLTNAFLRRYSRGQALRFFGLGLAMALVLFTIAQGPVLTISASLLIGCLATANVTLATAFLDQLHGKHAAVSLAEANLFAAIAGFVSPLMVGLAVGLGWNWRIALWIAAGLLLLIEWRRSDLSEFDVADTNESVQHRRLPAAYWWAWTLLIFTAGTEFIFVLWSGPLLQERAGLGDAAAAASLATFTGGIAIGRGLTAKLATRFDPEAILKIAFAIPLIAFPGVWLATNALVMLACLLISGVGVGAHWPLGIGRVVKAGAVDPDSAATKSALATGGASMAFPFALGALADQIGVHSAFGFLPLLLLAGLVLLYLKPLEDSAAS